MSHRFARRLIFKLSVLMVVAATSSVGNLPAADPKADAKALLTEENFAKVRNGMTGDEVKAILGKAPFGGGTKADWTQTWQGTEKKQKIEVHFKDGVVDRKSSSFDWAKKAKPELGTTSKNDKPAAKSGDEKFDVIIKELRSSDEKKRQDAFKAICRLKFDDDKAPEVNKWILIHLKDKDDRVRRTAQEGMRTWVIPENADYFLDVLGHKPKTPSPNDPDRDQLGFAMEMLISLRDPRAAEGIAKVLHYSFLDRTSARDALIKLGPELAQPAVLKYADDKDNNVRMAAQEVLSKFKTSAGDLLLQHLNELKDDKPEKRYSAIIAIGRMDVDPQRRQEVAAALQAALTDNPGALNDDLKKGERDTKIGKTGKSIGGLMSEMQMHPANAAVMALGKWGGPENEAAVVEQLSSKILDMRVGAARALGAFATKRSLPALQKAALAEKDSEVGRHSRDAIAAIQARGK